MFWLCFSLSQTILDVLSQPNLMLAGKLPLSLSLPIKKKSNNNNKNQTKTIKHKGQNENEVKSTYKNIVSILCLSTTPEARACPVVWLIYPVRIHRIKLVSLFQWVSTASSFLVRGGFTSTSSSPFWNFVWFGTQQIWCTFELRDYDSMHKTCTCSSQTIIPAQRRGSG